MQIQGINWKVNALKLPQRELRKEQAQAFDPQVFSLICSWGALPESAEQALSPVPAALIHGIMFCPPLNTTKPFEFLLQSATKLYKVQTNQKKSNFAPLLRISSQMTKIFQFQ